MKDFTKNELEWIYEGMECVVGVDSQTPEDILLKVREMIDNYCEHDYSEKSLEVHVKQCCKCQDFKVL